MLTISTREAPQMAFDKKINTSSSRQGMNTRCLFFCPMKFCGFLLRRITLKKIKKISPRSVRFYKGTKNIILRNRDKKPQKERFYCCGSSSVFSVKLICEGISKRLIGTATSRKSTISVSTSPSCVSFFIINPFQIYIFAGNPAFIE